MHRKAPIALAVICAALALPAAATAASVAVTEQPGNMGQARLEFNGAAAEANDVSLEVSAETDDFYELLVLDRGAALDPGPGCEGGGAPGVAVTCTLHRPLPGNNYYCFKSFCSWEPGTRWEVSLFLRLGDGGSRLDATALPAGGRDPAQSLAPEMPLKLTVTPGAGDDTVLTGAGPDLIEPSFGDDLIRTGRGSDELRGGPVPDGADDVAFGQPAYARVDYSERTAGVAYNPNGVADDGAEGEGDNLGPAGSFEGGAGDDVLVAASPPVVGYGAWLLGNDGDDLLRGGSGGDYIYGGEGNDRMFGEAGDDQLIDIYDEKAPNPGDDSAEGGEGEDKIELGPGNDRAEGGPGDDLLYLGSGADRGYGEDGRDRIALGPGPDFGSGGAGGDLLLGEAGNDELRGGAGPDRLAGNGGSDRMFGERGEDAIAAGFAVAHPWGHRAFLKSPGPLEGKSDLVECGPGLDATRIGPTDTAHRCETVRPTPLLELRGTVPRDRYPATWLLYTIRRPGKLELSIPGLRRSERISQRSYQSGYFELSALGAALTELRERGRARLPFRLQFRAVDGRRAGRSGVAWVFRPAKIVDEDPG